MNALNLTLLHALSPGSSPSPTLLFVARLLALWGAWACAAAIGWAAWQRRADTLYLLAVAAGAALASVLSHAIAARLDIPRPFVAGWVPAYIAHGSSPSLPSTHATVMFFVAVALLMRAGLRRTGIIALALACMVGWARIYVGVHTPLDIAAGLALGTVMAAVLGLLWRRPRRPTAGTGPVYGGTP
ncbi:phosphatase PAP2 family protein [Variovorax sp. N23]|uniref:phosphatase PAP2 family protein n=1 Tax=Variovorax sp. N23 TaxID=2980555 RepID=UPI0021C5BBC1|nr:phosphatase PAP2 family protein [Variovorax sp. N23]MCU4118507.1 phosphatase PAP2 family protein [Variovorax sp. N23]